MSDIAQSFSSDTSAPTNVGGAERALSTIGGALIVIDGLRSGSTWGALRALVGAVLIARGVGGHCPAYAALGMNTAEDDTQAKRLGGQI
ncbi:hypothetical protein GCM10007036_22630 [Alsobacter metallidurans]|uniref:Inner membrane protein YgaP-like transmembrane domain-containing protein n=1 Tax=Alsobacter metallidurans TaxID=340221 RepID=A0A917I7J0_9HYPH|nr:DUF2892 domain-containing protein [Alsobacter metallidurans]GGH19608.1 hypothetical protein GCM10007036_22630 [Alsobacter metallidurans]